MKPATVQIEIDWDTANIVVLALDLLIGAYGTGSSAAELAEPYRARTRSAEYKRARAAIDHFSAAAAEVGRKQFIHQELK